MKNFDYLYSLFLKDVGEDIKWTSIEKILAEKKEKKINLKELESVLNLKRNQYLSGIIRELFDFAKELNNHRNGLNIPGKGDFSERKKTLLMYLGDVNGDFSEKEVLEPLLLNSKFYHLILIVFLNLLKHYNHGFMAKWYKKPVLFKSYIHKDHIDIIIKNDYNDYNKRLINQLLNVKKDGTKIHIQTLLKDLGGELHEFEASCQIFVIGIYLKL